MDAPFDRKKTGDALAGTLAFPRRRAGRTGKSHAPGAILSGKYRLEAMLGEGGMGAVWRASNLLLDLPVAIKLIRADLDRSVLRARLQVEARSTAKLGHPAIVRVYDVGESELGDPFIVMELMHGQTLAKMITQGRLSAARTVQLLLPIIDALAVAHTRGIVHRDLKPDNIMIAQEQLRVQPKILDFGIAKLTDPRDSDHKLTEIGMVVGSPDYMSPEQARGRDDVDAGSDIWAICVCGHQLYEAASRELSRHFTPAAHNTRCCVRSSKTSPSRWSSRPLAMPRYGKSSSAAWPRTAPTDSPRSPNWAGLWPAGCCPMVFSKMPAARRSNRSGSTAIATTR